MIWWTFNQSFREFCRLGKNEPGILLEASINGKLHRLLIGDVSQFGSVMNGDTLLLPETIIHRYARIWSR